MPLAHTDLDLRQQQQHAAGRDQAHHHLQRPADLGEHLADLTQDGADIQQADGRKLAVQLGQHRGTVIPAEAGEPALRLPVQRPGGENKEEVGPQALPVDFAHAAHLRAEVLSIAGKGHRIADLHPQPLRQPLLNRYLARLRRPAAGHQRIMIRTLFAPGEIKLAIQRFVFVPVRGVAVDLRQTGPDDRIKFRRPRLVFGEESLHRHYLLRGDIDQKVVWALRGQLLLPAVEQIAAQHQQQRQQHKRQGKRRQLAEGRPRLAQQAVHRQTQRQGAERQAFEQPQQSPAHQAAQQRQHHRPGQHRPQQGAAAHQPRQQAHHHGADRRDPDFQRPDVSHHVLAQHPQRQGRQQQPIGAQAHQQGNHAGRAHRPQPRPAAGRRERGGQNRFEHQQQQALQR